ncbi:MAG TPA: pitrilysin family protein [Verrucomicrobiota bacterium]|nr:pitrilysin family protein [Verrucomicrobiota bacterium]
MKTKTGIQHPHRRALGQALGLAISLAGLAPGLAQQVPVEERTLSNGMKLLMVERHRSPAVAGGWVARVGSVNERPGITGIAHLFEHMMFKGTPTIGTSDAKRDAEIIEQQEQVRDAMRLEEGKMRLALRRGEIDDLAKPENKTERYRELEVKFKELIDAHREVLVKNEFNRIYTTAGASGMNAFTSNDMTGYFITVPANKLELWAWMESERLLRPVFREFYAERDVVFEERRMRTESTPLGKFQESLEALFWESHPYGWPVIGWPSDIPAITKAQADEFYALHYAPQNITLILVGDFKADEAAKLCERYFGRIPRGERNAPEVVTLEVPQKVEKRMNAEAEANPQVDILWHTPAAGHPDAYALEVLAAVLSGRSGRLHKALVLGDGVATSVFAHQMARKYAGMFNIGGEAKDPKTPGDVEAAVYAQVERLKNEPVSARELQKVKNNFAAMAVRRTTSNFHLLVQLIQYEGGGDWKSINTEIPGILKVTAEDVQRVTGKYLTRENRTVATFTRKAGAKLPDDPAMVGLSGEQQAVVRRISSQIKSETNLERLQQQLETMETQLAQADGKQQGLMKIIMVKVAERIADLSK